VRYRRITIVTLAHIGSFALDEKLEPENPMMRYRLQSKQQPSKQDSAVLEKAGITGNPIL
jgi:hypothetical protein